MELELVLQNNQPNITFSKTEQKSEETDQEVEKVEKPKTAIYECCALPLNEVSSPTEYDGLQFMFTGLPDNADELIDIVDEHNDNAVVGRLTEPLKIDGDKLIARFRLFDTSFAKDMKVLISESVKTGLSVKAYIFNSTQDTDGVTRVHEYQIAHIGIVRSPAFGSASNIQIVSASTNPKNNIKENKTMENQNKNTVNERNENTTNNNNTSVAGFSLKDIVNEVKTLINNEKNENNMIGTFSKYDSLTSAVSAIFEAKTPETIAKFSGESLIDTTKAGDNVRPAWQDNLVYYRDLRQPLISLMGRESLDEAYTIQWAEVTTDVDGLFKNQSAEGTELETYEIATRTLSSTLKTAGVQTRESFQMLRTATPAYRSQILTAGMDAYNRFMEAEFEKALVSKATAKGNLTNHTKINDLRSQLIDASIEVMKQTGVPASFVACSEKIFKQIATIPELYNPTYGTQNIHGLSGANTLKVEVDGLPILCCPFIPDNTVLVSNDTVAKFSETGALVATQDNIGDLTSKRVIWGMYRDDLVTYPKGLLKFTVNQG